MTGNALDTKQPWWERFSEEKHPGEKILKLGGGGRRKESNTHQAKIR